MPALPRGAAVELHVAALRDDFTKRTCCHVTNKVASASIECHAVMSADRCSASISLRLTAPNGDPAATAVRDVTEAVGVTFKRAVEKMEADLVPLCARVFFRAAHSLATQVAEGMLLKTHTHTHTRVLNRLNIYTH